jgi:hypothetical protein
VPVSRIVRKGLSAMRDGQRLLAVSLAVALCSLVSCECGPKWNEAFSEAGEFSVSFPAPIQDSARPMETSLGPLHVSGFLSSSIDEDEASSQVSQVEYVNLSNVATGQRAALLEEVLKIERVFYEGGSCRAKTLRHSEFRDQACAGSEIVMVCEYDSWVRMRGCLSGDLLYLRSILGRQRIVNGELGKRFFESFKILRN